MEPDAGPFLCAGCEKPILTEHVLRIEAEAEAGNGRGGGTAKRGSHTGYMLITHHCPCSSLLIRTRRYGSYAAFVAMFGRGVRLPYESPFRLTDVADDDPLLVRWRWELEQTADADEFLLWLQAHRR